MKQLAEPFMGFLLLFLVFLVSRYGTEQVLSEQALAGLKQPKQPVVVVDAGHGGNDPGKVAVNGSLEKDINLAIAKRLAWYLEQADVTVIMTRDSDSGLYSPTDSRKKTSDMERRCQIMNESKADLAVSIHQNSYHDEEISGGQVFYYADSAPGKRLAERIQKRFDYVLGAENRRQPKANSFARRMPCGDRGVRVFKQLAGGFAAGRRGISGPHGIYDPHGDFGIFKRGMTKEYYK